MDQSWPTTRVWPNTHTHTHTHTEQSWATVSQWHIYRFYIIIVHSYWLNIHVWYDWCRSNNSALYQAAIPLPAQANLHVIPAKGRAIYKYTYIDA